MHLKGKQLHLLLGLTVHTDLVKISVSNSEIFLIYGGTIVQVISLDWAQQQNENMMKQTKLTVAMQLPAAHVGLTGTGMGVRIHPKCRTLASARILGWSAHKPSLPCLCHPNSPSPTPTPIPTSLGPPSAAALGFGAGRRVHICAPSLFCSWIMGKKAIWACNTPGPELVPAHLYLWIALSIVH